MNEQQSSALTLAEALKPRASAWFESLRDRICAAAFEAIEDGGRPARSGPSTATEPGRFERTPWQRT
jgi:coproporphyrinogen III oxidase